MSGDEIRDDRRAGASELARRAVDLAARNVLGLGGVQLARREAGRLAGLRPSMAAIGGALDIFVEGLERLAREMEWNGAVEAARLETLERLGRARGRVAEHAAAVIGRLSPARIVTVSCSSTVRACLEAVHPAAVLVSEGRPGLEGRAIALEVAGLAGRVTLCTDAALPGLVEAGDMVLTGADAVEPDGHLVNKVGTLALALAAARAGVPFYAAVEGFKFTEGPCVVLEEMEGDEVWPGAPQGVAVRNPYFERTPPDLVTGFITDDGVVRAAAGGWKPA
jgi:translation initiation factor 2B subunit (eIF-2B alpha/beta/delta family)